MSQIENYKFYLNFKNEDSFGRIEITEPIGFDGASFVVEQDDARFGRDVYKISEEISLEFYKGNFDSTNTFQQLPNGTTIYNLTQGFEWIIETYKKHGFESDVDFEIELEGLVFIPSNLDFSTSETDGYSKFSCSATQEQDRQIIKRRSDITTDIFSTEDLDGNTVTPAETQNILLRAKPETQQSSWSSLLKEERQFIITISNGHINFASAVNSYGIDDTLSFLLNLDDSIYDFKYLKAQNSLSNVRVEISNLNMRIEDVQNGSGNLTLRAVVFDDENNVYNTYDLDTISNNQAFNENYSLLIPEIPLGLNLAIAFRKGGEGVIGRASTMDVDIYATATAIDSIIKGIRLIDVYKENLKRINGWEVYAPRFDVGGEYYDQFAFTGNLIKQRDDVPFPVDFETITEDLMELCSDYQITDKLYIGQYQDFYANKEIGAFLMNPDDTMITTFNERYTINEFGFKYDNYEKDDEEVGTTDAINTESQWLLENKQVENTKDIDVNWIRDSFKIEKTRKEAFQETTATEEDDKMFVLDVVPLSPTERGGFPSSLRHYIDEVENGNDRVKLMRNENMPSWSLIGVSLGGEFNILEGENVGSYIVYDIEDSIITLTPTNPLVQTFSGIIYTVIDFPYTNVALVNRTNEGLEYFENLLNGDNFANLKYSIKRNMETWKPYLSTASIFKPNGTLKNTYFKSNGNCITRFDWETENVKENADILNENLGNPILTPNVYETRLLVPFAQMVELMNALDTVNDDDSIGGFIRCIDNNGRVIRLYPKIVDYVPSTETLTLTGEQRYDGEGVTITTTSETITINEVGYDISVLDDPYFEMDGDYLKIKDSDKRAVITPTKYDEVTLNGVTYESSSLLMDALVS